MTRLLALSAAVFALAFSACEKHPLDKETPITFTHGSGGTEGEEHAAEKKSEGAAKEEKKEEKGGAAEAKH